MQAPYDLQQRKIMTIFYNDQSDFSDYPEDGDIYNPLVPKTFSADEEWEKRRKRWQERRWLGEPSVVADDWLFAPLPISTVNNI